MKPSPFLSYRKKRRERMLQRMAAMRAAKERRRQALASLDPIRHPGTIVLRVIAIRNEVDVQEAIVFDTDSLRETKSKLRRIGL